MKNRAPLTDIEIDEFSNSFLEEEFDDEDFTNSNPSNSEAKISRGHGKIRRKDMPQAPKPKAAPEQIFEVEQPCTLLDFMFEKLSSKSRTTIKSYLAHRQISVGGIPTTRFDLPLKEGDRVSLTFSRMSELFYHRMLRVVYEDDYIIVVDKKNGLLSMATDRERTKTAYYILSEYVKKLDPRNRIFIVHRLDRETSGLMVFAKTMDIQHQMQKNWEQIVLERKYVAVVGGTPRQEEGVVSNYLAQNSAFMVYSSDNPNDGELAVTHYKVLKSGGMGSLVECELETGKTNQIRVHMKDLGCPIIGDKKYGGQESPINRIALHARKIVFIHPITGKEMLFDTGVPPKFLTLLKNRQYND